MEKLPLLILCKLNFLAITSGYFFLFKDENPNKFGGKYVVEMDRERPSWWTPRQLGKS